MHAISWYIYVWLLSLSAVIRFHNIPPVRRKKQIYVANHTTVLDFLVISQHANFATVGQKHGGVMGLIQDKVITPLGNIWFERFESRDRKLVAKRILSHIDDLSKPPLMIFPEGVCVNNEYIVMFKKGVFEIEDVEICPIALKYKYVAQWRTICNSASNSYTSFLFVKCLQQTVRRSILELQRGKLLAPYLPYHEELVFCVWYLLPGAPN